MLNDHIDYSKTLLLFSFILIVIHSVQVWKAWSYKEKKEKNMKDERRI